MVSALLPVMTTWAALTTITKSPVSTCGANCGLCLPRSRIAAWLARRPSTTSDASMTCHARVTSPGLGVYVGHGTAFSSARSGEAHLVRQRSRVPVGRRPGQKSPGRRPRTHRPLVRGERARRQRRRCDGQRRQRRDPGPDQAPVDVRRERLPADRHRPLHRVPPRDRRDPARQRLGRHQHRGQERERQDHEVHRADHRLLAAQQQCQRVEYDANAAASRITQPTKTTITGSPPSNRAPVRAPARGPPASGPRS